MDLVARASGGHNLVARPQGRPTWQPPATAPAAHVVVWKRDLDKPLHTASRIGEYLPGGVFVFDFRPGESRNIELLLVSFSAAGIPSVTNLRDAVRVSLAYLISAETAAGIDEHVPVVTQPPIVSFAEGDESSWIVITPAPDANAATLGYGEIKVEKAGDPTVFRTWGLSVSKQERIPREAFACNARYRWWNRSGEDIYGDPDDPQPGWSAWSPPAGAPAMFDNAGLAPASEAVTNVDFDPEGSMAAIERGFIVE
jgi:hypothetical protein